MILQSGCGLIWIKEIYGKKVLAKSTDVWIFRIPPRKTSALNISHNNYRIAPAVITDKSVYVIRWYLRE